MRAPTWVRLVSPLALAVALHGAVGIGAPREAAAQQQGSKGATVGSLIVRGSDLFDDQQYEESIQTLSAALVRPGATPKEKTEILRLLAYNYITLKRTDEADSAVRAIYVADETFKLPPTESPRFRDFFDATRAKWEAEGKPGKDTGGTSPGDQKPIKLTYTSPAQVESGSKIRISGAVDDPDSRVRGVQVFYRTGAKGKYVTVVAAYSMGQFRAQIPDSAVKPPLVEYYIEGVDKGGLPIVSRGDAGAPLRIAVPEPSGGVLSSPWFWVPVGLAVVGGAVATVLILSASSNTATVSVSVRE